MIMQNQNYHNNINIAFINERNDNVLTFKLQILF